MTDRFENDLPSPADIGLDADDVSRTAGPNPREKDLPPKEFREQKYKVGDIVQLKSGGPDMTISGIRPKVTSNLYTCQWFSGKKLESGEFPEESLQVPETKK